MMSFHQQQQMMHGDGLVAQRSIMTPMGQGLTVTPFMPLIKKPDFPPDMQMVFVIPQIANIGKQIDKTKCRPLDPVIGTGRYSEWILDRFEDGWEAEARLNSLPQGIQTYDMEVVPNVPKPKNDKMAKGREQVIQNLQKWNPYEKEEMTTDPFKTLFVGRLSYQTNEKRLRKEFESYGPIKSVHIMKNVINGEPRGYAFIEFEHKSDFLEAYKYGEGKRIDGRKIVVDYERGRTQLKWRPRRLGGGLGETRRTKSVEVKRDIKDEEKRSKSKSSRSASNHRRRGGNRGDDFRLRLRRSPPQRRGGGGGFRGDNNERGPRNFGGGGRDFRDNHFQRGGDYHHNNQHQQHNVHMQHSQPVQSQPLQLKRMEIEKREEKEPRDRSRSRSEKKHRKREKGGLDFKENKDGKDKKKDKKKHKKHRDDDPYDVMDNQELGQVDGSQKKKKKRKDDKDKDKKKKKRKE